MGLIQDLQNRKKERSHIWKYTRQDPWLVIYVPKRFIKYILSHKGRSAHSSIKCSEENITDREGKQKFFLLLIEINVVYQLL